MKTFMTLLCGALIISATQSGGVAFAASTDEAKPNPYWMGRGHMNGTGPGYGYGPGFGYGMMGGGYGMMGGTCPFGVPEAKVDVKETKDGAIITLVGKSKEEIARIQKMVKIMKLQHEIDTE